MLKKRLVLILMSLPTLCYGSPAPKATVMAGGGIITREPTHASQKLDGIFSQTRFYGGFKGLLPVMPSTGIVLEPGLKLIFPGHADESNEMSYSTGLLLSAHAGYFLLSSFQLRLGTSLLKYSFSTTSGTFTDRMGNTYTRPSLQGGGWIAGLDGGVSFYLTKRLRATGDVIVWYAFDSLKRRASLLIGAEYALF